MGPKSINRDLNIAIVVIGSSIDELHGEEGLVSRLTYHKILSLSRHIESESNSRLRERDKISSDNGGLGGQSNSRGGRK